MIPRKGRAPRGCGTLQRQRGGLLHKNFGNDKWRLGALYRPTGLNLTGGYAVQKFDVGGSRHSHGFIGYPAWRRKLFDLAETKTAFDFTCSWDVT